MTEVEANAKIIWDYMLMHQELRPMDAIFVLGANDVRVAEWAANLYFKKYAPIIIFSGGFGKDTKYAKSEADTFADVAIAAGVPSDKIIKETQSTNTGENVLFVRKLLKESGLSFNSFILVQKPYMERRTYATFKNFWPEAECIVTSPPISFEEYAANDEFKRLFTELMVGDLQRIKEYPAKGFQIPQEIPQEVWDAYEKLVELGYTKYVMPTV